MNGYYAQAIPTVDEFNQKNGSDNLAMRTSIFTKERYNMNVYLMLAFILFLVFGCGFAVLFGRLGDFIDYFMYMDRKTGLPNRNRCDRYIEGYEDKVLADNFACMVCKMNLENHDNLNYTRRDGDILLARFGSFLKRVIGDDGFAGYNNDGMFIVFLENCTYGKAATYGAYLNELVTLFNNSDAVYPILYHTGVAESTKDNAYNIRELLRAAIKNAYLEAASLEAETEKE